MMTLYDRIQELKAEMKYCRLTRRERAEAEAELVRMTAEWAAIERKIAADFEQEEPPA